ncbi:PH domain-containing protein [Candidatus Nitrososphaera gargensis]|uniref:PH domain-containing protein n=1 Tax=Candidatus Nitrososphaera gargensis TaxID=497727 RepID=UPI0011E511DF|nr:PH domain-containing protein [Candidatus Nitrososphaera gargensis]
MEVPDDILPLLDEDEKVLFNIKQRKYRPSINIESATITNKRIILRRPSMLRIKKSYVDYSYGDITNIVLDKGPLRSTIMLNLKMDANDLVLEDIPNEMAQQAFRLIREGIDRAREAADAA